MSVIAIADLEPLLAQGSGEGMVLSCYADMTGAEGFRRNWMSRFQSNVDVLVKEVGKDGPARQELERNLDTVRGALEAPESRGARWLAVFCAASRGFLRTYRLDAPVETGLVLDRSPYLVPLLAAIHQRREHLVVHTDTHRGRLFAATMSGVRLLEQLEEEVPKKQHSAGERWGKEQATIARHRDECIHHYLKSLVGRIEHHWLVGRYAGVVLLGEHTTVEHLRKSLPARLVQRIAGEAPAPWYDRPSEIEDSIQATLARAADAEDASIRETFTGRLREGRAIAVGPQAVLDALNCGRIGSGGFGSLVVGPDPHEVVGRCTVCRTLAFDAPANCPRCQAPCAVGSLWEEILLTAFRHNVEVHMVKDQKTLAAEGGMVALLPKPERSELHAVPS